MKNNTKLIGKNVLITAGAQGIGEAMDITTRINGKVAGQKRVPRAMSLHLHQILPLTSEPI